MFSWKCSVGSGDTDIHKLKPTDLHETNSGKVSMVWSSKKKKLHILVRSDNKRCCARAPYLRT